jgi:nitroreductase
MNVEEAIKNRKSIRKFKEHNIKSEEIQKIMDAAILAPSAKNLQPCKFIIVESQKKKEELAKACLGQDFIASASIIIVCVINESLSKWTTLDAGIAIQQMVLQAQELEYGSCWIGALNQEEVKQVLNIPAHLKVVAVLPIGKTAIEPERRPRKSREEVFFFEEFGKN